MSTKASPTNAIQKTERHKANVMMASFHLVGYSKSSSSSPLLAVELRFSLTCASFSSMVLSCIEAAREGEPLSPTPFSFFSRSPTLRAAVLSESVMLTGRSVWSLTSLIWPEGRPMVLSDLRNAPRQGYTLREGPGGVVK
jgi:hypothetical protein